MQISFSNFNRAFFFLFCVSLKAAEVATPSPESIEFFEKKIRPVLIESCEKCHSTKSEKLKGALLLDSRLDILKGGETGPAAKPGHPDESLLIKAIRYTDPDLQMPPKHRLTADQVRDFEEWVRLGLPDPRSATPRAPALAAPRMKLEEGRKFWSFQAVTARPTPTVANRNWARGDVDRYLLAKMESHGLTPSADLDKSALLRRVTYDLTGMPPTPEELRAFLADPSEKSFATVVDRLLASPRYGEQWGRHWLDLTRYADTSGCNADFPVPSAHRYRDYVIDSFNADRPYDQFIREQIAGDLLPSANVEEHFRQLIATGYLATARRFGSGNHDFHLTLEDLIDNLGKTVLGLSLGCARCHDHKFDPIFARDYYAIYGIFESTRFAFPGTELYPHTKDFTPLIADPAEAARNLAESREVAQIDGRIKDLREEKKQLENLLKNAALKPVSLLPSLIEAENIPVVEKPARTPKDCQREQDAAIARQLHLLKSADGYPKAYAVTDGDRVGNSRIHRKGDRQSPGEEVPRGFLAILGEQTLPRETVGSGRRELAEWLVAPTNPLTARVMVNRIWQLHFGVGLVKTPNDFGIRGAPPSHPELLDWLAIRFVESGWSVKALHRMLLLSHAYQMASDPTPEALAKDINNEFLSHFNRRRLSAEELRDSLLLFGGNLDSTPAGPHPFPKEITWKFTQHNQFFADYPTLRRSVYLIQQRIRKQPYLETFDGADPNATTPIRAINHSPIQALWMLNANFAHDQSQMFAERVRRQFPQLADQISAINEAVLGRPATTEEVQSAEDYLRQIADALPPSVTDRSLASLASYCRVIFGSNAFVFIE